MSELEHLQERNWLELPYDVTANILSRIGTIDILKNTQKVCTLWRKICKENPAMWRVINMKDFLMPDFIIFLFEDLFKDAIDRSQGQLVDFTFLYTLNDSLLLYVADRSSVLKYLKVTCCLEYQPIKGLTESLMKFPLLEELSLCEVKISKEAIETASRHCPKLKTLKVNQRACKLCVGDATEESLSSYNDVAIAIGGSLHELKHLELIGNKMSNIGLQVILDGCRHLETLDLRECFYIDLEGNHIARRLKQISHLKLPTDSLECDPYVFGRVCPRHDTDYAAYLDYIDGLGDDYADYLDYIDALGDDYADYLD